MGVAGLWTIVQPCARPVKLETLARKRLAVDASIWIYQFLKAVRDSEGNALRNSHLVGFFRRICKLLFHGIRPVFVFDGGAPVLKRQTVAARKSRREGRREDAARTAGKLLALQVKRRMEMESERRRRDVARRDEPEEEVPGEDEFVYVEELQQTQKERMKNRSFKKTDAYQLPDLDASLENMGQPNDPRLMSLSELQSYASQFHTGEPISLYDFTKIDFTSPFFLSLPAADRYNILNAARARSRLRMGLSKEQLDNMFPDRLAFSKFQIERVKERNELTQRLMNLNGMNDGVGIWDANRVAGEKGREYVLVKNEGVEGGWALGVVGSGEGEREGERSRPIVVGDGGGGGGGRKSGGEEEEVEEEEDEDFEDVPIEGLNRLPKIKSAAPHGEGSGEEEEEGGFGNLQDAEAQMLRRALYESRKKDSELPIRQKTKANSFTRESSAPLFLGPGEADDDDDEEMENMFFPDAQNHYLEADDANNDEDQNLQKAIAMSLDTEQTDNVAEEADQLRRAIALSQHDNSPPGLGDLSNPTNTTNTTNKGKGKSKAIDLHLSSPGSPSNDYRTTTKQFDKDNDEDFHRAIFESKRTQQGESSLNRVGQSSSNPFGGLLPFEPLEFSKKSFLVKKKKKQEEEPPVRSGSGKNKDGDKGKGEAEEEKVEAVPLPPWFVAGTTRDLKEEMQKASQEKDAFLIEKQKEYEEMKMLESDKRLDWRGRDDGFVVIEEEEEEDVLMMADVPSSNGKKNEEGKIDRFGKTMSSEKVSEGNIDKEISTAGLTSSVIREERAGDDNQALEWEESDHEAREKYPPTANVLESIRISAKPSHPVSPPSPDYPPESQYSPPHPLPSPSVPPELDEDHEFSDPEDAELLQQLALESQEHARFAAELNHKKTTQTQTDIYERELRALRSQQAKDRRDADEVTQVMIQECQALLKLFGIPYITAPMEAEAQCAELVHLGLVDGIVTDDSDIFLFGGTRVYKNMFNQAKYVECYLASDLEKEFSLDRQKLIKIAHLLGSDYTDGLPSVGPVTALELLAEFASDDGLAEFRDWWTKLQQGQDIPDDPKNKFRKKFRKNIAKIFLPASFPSEAVDKAYLYPEVDKDPSEFTWGVPDLDGLRSFLMATIGWSQERTDEVLVPVIRDMNRKQAEGTQANITNFFSGTTGAGAFAPRQKVLAKSKRMGKAMLSLQEQAVAARTRREEEEEEEDEVQEEEEEAGGRTGRRKGKVPTAVRVVGGVSGGASEVQVEEEDGEEEEEEEDYQQQNTTKPKTGGKRKRTSTMKKTTVVVKSKVGRKKKK